MITEDQINFKITDIKSHCLYNRTPPDYLFHYTTINGFKGIIESKSLWLTKAAYLNDKTELKLAIERFQNEVEIIIKTEASLEIIDLLGSVAKNLNSFEETNICLASFCENGDILSQWRGYGNTGSGLALGFNGAYLNNISKCGWVKLLRCVYNPDEQGMIIRDLIALLRDSYINIKQNSNPIEFNQLKNKLIKNFNSVFMEIAPVLKNEHFSEEREWRLASSPRLSTDPNFRANLTSEKISIYYVYNFEADSSNKYTLIPKITIGPSAEYHRLTDALITHCDRNDFQVHEYRPSAIPFRG